MREPTTSCPYERAQQAISGKWSLIIVLRLMRGPKRFNELQRELDSVTPGTLTKQLRGLEAAGIVSRREYAGEVPHVEYSLTEIGRALEPVVREFAAWARAYANQGNNRAAQPQQDGLAR